MVAYRKLAKTKSARQMFLAEVFQSTIDELTKSQDIEVKQIAATKVLFLLNEQVEGVQKQAAFSLLQLMGSSPKLSVKLISYNLAPYMLKSRVDEAEYDTDEKELRLLTPNIFLKDLRSLEGSAQVASVSATCLSRVCDPELAQLLYKELFPLFNCQKPALRKKACVLCYKFFLHQGENEHIMEELAPYLCDRLGDSNISVKMAAISTIYEIARINPAVFIVTIPQVFQMLCDTQVHNNWLLIKVIKVLTEFCEVEPRLKTKLKPKFKQLLEKQSSKSVQYEVVCSCLHIFDDQSDIYDLALRTLVQDFIEQPQDPNLRLLGLQALELVIRNNEKQKELFGARILKKFH